MVVKDQKKLLVVGELLVIGRVVKDQELLVIRKLLVIGKLPVIGKNSLLAGSAKDQARTLEAHGIASKDPMGQDSEWREVHWDDDRQWSSSYSSTKRRVQRAYGKDQPRSMRSLHISQRSPHAQLWRAKD